MSLGFLSESNTWSIMLHTQVYQYQNLCKSKGWPCKDKWYDLLRIRTRLNIYCLILKIVLHYIDLLMKWIGSVLWNSLLFNLESEPHQWTLRPYQDEFLIASSFSELPCKFQSYDLVGALSQLLVWHVWTWPIGPLIGQGRWVQYKCNRIGVDLAKIA